MEEVSDNEEPQGLIHYLATSCGSTPCKNTTKVRVVYDVSAAKMAGPSLNDCLYTGPKFDQHILDILLRFCTNLMAVAADVEKAFLVICS